MNSSLNRRLASGLTLALLMAAASCGSHSIIGQQSGQGGSSGMGGTGTGGFGMGGDAGGGGPIGEFGGSGPTGGSFGTGGQAGGGNLGRGGATCPPAGGAPGNGLSFSAPVQYFTHAGSFLVAVGDLNGDGKPDLAVANYATPINASGAAGSSGAGGSGTGGGPGSNQGSVSVFLSSTAGYGAPQSYTLGTIPSSIAAGDLNGDGKADVAIVNSQGVSVFFNDGNGKLLSPVSFATGSGPVWVAVGDLNGDGKADLAVANQGSYNGSQMGGGDVAVLLNMGSGTFLASNYAAGASPVALTIADLNGDGRPDLAVASGTGVNVLFNAGSGVFGAPGSMYGSGTNPFSVAAGDLNGDGKIDLAVAQATSLSTTESVLLNVGNGVNLSPGTFAAAVNYIYGEGYPGPVAIGDLDGDGRPDLAFDSVGSCTGVDVLPNQGNGVFGAPSFFPVMITGSPASTTLADLNGDGKLDLVVANGDGVAVMLNTTP